MQILFPVDTLWEPQTHIWLWESIGTAMGQHVCMHVYRKPNTACSWSTNRTYWGIPVSFLRRWQFYLQQAQPATLQVTWQSNPMPGTYRHSLDPGTWDVTWTSSELYLPVQDFVLSIIHLVLRTNISMNYSQQLDVTYWYCVQVTISTPVQAVQVIMLVSLDRSFCTL